MTNDSVTLDPKAMQTQLFRGAVVDILPGDEQRKLADIPGLDTMLHDQWAETLKHFFKAHQETEKALDKQGTEVTRKLAQASLDQLKKLKGMGYVVKSGPEDGDEAGSHGPVRKCSETPSSAPTTVQLIESPRQTDCNRTRSRPRKRGKRGARGQKRREIKTCWGCNLEGTVQLIRGKIPEVNTRSAESPALETGSRETLDEEGRPRKYVVGGGLHFTARWTGRLWDDRGE
ncbi:hypothetical protein DPEC_G00282720 [Dallia pectoralis]|uniref:Uncharacterized protein n=1 Tax=Dallia pectoralis TaxID=75939 RepID=A0ACC2FIQ5_DALPE|nr:hypothetical protein DPEC_G00282720 [Dallia pectoralis]